MAGELVSLDDQIAEIDREIGFRERVYPRWVNAKSPRLSLQAAVLHMARLRAVRRSLLELKQLREGGGA